MPPGITSKVAIVEAATFRMVRVAEAPMQMYARGSMVLQISCPLATSKFYDFYISTCLTYLVRLQRDCADCD